VQASAFSLRAKNAFVIPYEKLFLFPNSACVLRSACEHGDDVNGSVIYNM
jgi:hypothetical protein